MTNLKKPVLTTPVGNAIHPWISNADVQFHPEGKFHTKLAISDEIEAKSNAQQKLDANKKITYANKPYEITADGKCVFKLQTKFRPTILDNKLKPLADDVKIFGGSKLRITFEAFGYNMPVGIGCSLRMKQVQVLELVTGTLGDALGDLKVEPDVQPKIKQEISL